LEYLEQMGSDHCPVLMISSSSREDKGSALKALELGAADYVEKPSLQNFKRTQEEICFKLKMLAEKAGDSGKKDLALEKKFASRDIDVQKLKPKQWVIVVGDGSLSEIKKRLESVDMPSQHIALGLTDEISNHLSSAGVKTVELSQANASRAQGLQISSATVVPLDQVQNLKNQGFEFVYLLVGDAKSFFTRHAGANRSDAILMEDLEVNRAWIGKVRYAVPLTSAGYHMRQIFSERKAVA
ncbi:MAG: hypothetical protein AAF202_02220, partial [Pseudomonadota bacterium]